MAKKFIACFVLFCSLIFLAAPAWAVDWYNESWNYRKPVTVTNPSAGYVMSESQLTIYYNDGTKTGAGEVDCEGHCRTDFDDIRITKSDGTTLLPYDVDSETDSDNMVITVTADTNPIYVYYGNASATVMQLPDMILDSRGINNGSVYIDNYERIYFALMDAGYDPTLTYYDKATGQFASDYYRLDLAEDEDVHNWPSMVYSDKYDTLHVFYSGHYENPFKYLRSYAGHAPALADNSSIEVGSCGPYNMETDFAETDPNSHITTSGTRATFASINRNEDAWLSVDKGADYYSGDFEFTFTLKATTPHSAYGVLYLVALTNEVDDIKGLYDGGKDYLTIFLYRDSADSKYQLALRECNGGVNTTSTFVDISDDTEYFIKFRRDEAEGTYGKAYMEFYTDATYETSHAVLTDQTVTLTEKQDFRYLMPINTYNSAQATRYLSGYIENLTDSLGSGGGESLSSDSDRIVGQTFTTAASARPVSHIDFYAKKVGSPTGNATVSVYATSAGKPTGTALTTGTFDVSELGTAFALNRTAVTYYDSLSDSTMYAVTVEYSNGDESNYITIASSEFNTYASGTLVSTADGGSNWTITSGTDLAMIVNELNWEQMAEIGSYYTYPTLFTRTSGETEYLYCFNRGGTATTYDYRMLVSTDNGDNWSTTTLFDGTDGVDHRWRPYHGVHHCEVEDDGTLWVTLSVCDDDIPSPHYYYNVYLMVYDPVSARWENVGGDDLTADMPMEKTDLDDHCLVAECSGPHLMWQTIRLDGAGNPAIVWKESDGTYWEIKFRRWNGSSWEDEVFVAEDVCSDATYDDHRKASFAFVYTGGSGATAKYDVYYPGGHRTTTDGGANWSNGASPLPDGAVEPQPVEGDAQSDINVWALSSDADKPFPVTMYMEPTPSGLYYNSAQGNAYAFQDKFERDGVSQYANLGNAPDGSIIYAHYFPAGTGEAPTCALGSGMVTFPASTVGEYERIHSLYNSPTSGWTGYHVHFELPEYSDRNLYTYQMFGTVKENSWETETANKPDDGVWVYLHGASGSKVADVSVYIGGVAVIDSDDNAIGAGSDFDIYVEKDVEGDVITIKNNSNGTTVYNGTVPDSGQIDDATLNVFMGQMAVGGTSSAVYFDNVTLAEWSPTAPTWGVAGSEESLGSGQHIIMIW